METVKLRVGIVSKNAEVASFLGRLINDYLVEITSDAVGQSIAKMVGLKFAATRKQNSPSTDFRRELIEVYFQSALPALVGQAADALGKNLISVLEYARASYKDSSCCEKHKLVSEATFTYDVSEITHQDMLDAFKKALTVSLAAQAKTQTAEKPLENIEDSLREAIQAQFPNAEVVFVDSLDEAEKYMKAYDSASIPSRDNPTAN